MSQPLWIRADADVSVGTATIAAATDLLTITAHGLSDGQPVVVSALSGGAVGVLADGGVYYVRDVTTDTFALARTLGGLPVDFTSDGGADVHLFEPGYDQVELRRADSALMYKDTADGFAARSGIHPSNEPAVTVAGTTWTVHDITGEITPSSHATGNGPYRFAHPEESGSLNPADGAQDRLDVLDLLLEDNDADGSGERQARVVYTAGAPGSPPVLPAALDNALRLTRGGILVSAGGSPAPAVQSPGALFTVAAGGALPVRTASELPAAGRYTGMAAFRQDVLAPVYWDAGSSAWVTGWPATVEAEDDSATTFTFTNTSFAVTGGPELGVVFTAPVTGRVMIYTNATIDNNNNAAVSYVAPAVRQGGTVGSGTVVLAAGGDRAVRTGGNPGGAARTRAGVSKLLSGLIPGNTYNVRLEHRVTSSTGSLLDRGVQVAPAT